MERDNVIKGITKQDFLNGRWFWCDTEGMMMMYVDDAIRPGHLVDKFLDVVFIVTEVGQLTADGYYKGRLSDDAVHSEIVFDECEVVKFSEVYS